MQTHIIARHTDVPDGLRAHIKTSVDKLGRFYGGIQKAHVVLNGAEVKAGAGKTAEVSLTLRRHQLRAQQSASTHQEAITGCVRQLRRQVLRYKDQARSTKQDRHR
jgi:putative sigma-54 modulation protein